MYIRNQSSAEVMIGGQQYPREGKPNLYPTAFPFDRCNQGNPGSIAFMALHGMASGVTTAVDLWGAATVRTLPTAGFTVGISSSSTADVKTSGTGAWTVEVDVLDTSYKAYTLTFDLNGRTLVSDTTLAGTAFRINDIRITSCGTGLANAGDIYVFDNSDTVTTGIPQTSTKIFHKMLATENIARGGFYTVPAGCRLQTQQFRGGLFDTTTTARAANFRLVYQGVDKISRFFAIAGAAGNGVGYITVDPNFPISIEEKTDISIRASASGSAVLAAFIDCVLYYK